MIKRHAPRLLTVALLALFWGLALGSALGKSPTMDEQNHIARGAAYLGTGDPRFSTEHPPLVNLLSALPAHLLLDLELPLDTVYWEMGGNDGWYGFADLFLWQVNSNVEQIVFLARLPIVGLGLVLVTLVFRWASARFGAWGGLLAAAFCALDPNILAHARLSTTDVGGACTVFLAAYALWRALRRPSWASALFSGLAFGLALSTKLSNLLFGPIFGLTVVAVSLAGGAGWLARLARNLALLAFTALVGLLVVWAMYGFQVGRLEGVAFPLPASPYFQGIRGILNFSAAGRPAYLLGRYNQEGWWYYFPVALAVKTPLPTLAALLVATLWLGRRRTARAALQDELMLLLPPAIYFCISMNSNLNIGYRHLLPVLPFLAVHVARLAPPARPATGVPRRSLARRFFPLLLVLWLAVVTVRIYPHFLAFFNPIGGGPENGWRVLVDSNIDWGQDLKGLRAWMERKGVGRVRLSWFGSARPEAYGIEYDLLPGVPHGFWDEPPFDREQPEPGVYAISVTNLLGVVLPDHDTYAWFRARPPADRIGYSIFIYEVSAP